MSIVYRRPLIPLALAAMLTFLLAPLVGHIERWIGRIAAVLIIKDDPKAPPGVEEDENHTRGLYCLPPRMATCYPRFVNRNIFYIIGVIVVIVIVLKVLHVF